MFESLKRWWSELTAPPKTIKEVVEETASSWLKEYCASPEFKKLVIDGIHTTARRDLTAEQYEFFKKEFKHLLKTVPKPIVELARQAFQKAISLNKNKGDTTNV